MTNAPMTVSPSLDRPASLVLRVVTDTWLKLSTASSSTLPDDQKQLVRAGTLLPLSAFQPVENDHVRIVLGTDAIGQKIHIRGRNTWYAYLPHVQILRDGQVLPLDESTPSPTSPPVPTAVAPTYTLKVINDTWFKLSTAMSSSLTDDQKQLVSAGTTFPVSSFAHVENNHIRVAFGLDEQGNQVQLQGRNTWYAYRPDVQLLRDGQVISWGGSPTPAPAPAPRPPVSTYALKLTQDTWLKQSTAQGSTLPDEQRQFVEAGTVLPISGYTTSEANHLKVTLGKDAQGQQIQFKGRNTWYVYQPYAQILRDGKVILAQTPAPVPVPTPAPIPTPAPTPRPPAPNYILRIKQDTWLKQSTAQSSTLSEEQKQLVQAGQVLPVSSYELAGDNHIKVSLGVDQTGQQVQFKGRNTWYVYRPAVDLLQGGRVIDLTPPQSGRRQINAKGLRLLKSFEGLRLEAYLDPVGIWTIGYGTTSGVYPGMRITEAQAEAFLRRDLARFERAVSELVQVPLNEDQFSALVSFTYNVGEGALASSTLLRLLNRRDYLGAADQLLRWNKGDGGRELAGLTRRRRAERALFLGQDYTAFL